jgi:hypothetical protein
MESTDFYNKLLKIGCDGCFQDINLLEGAGNSSVIMKNLKIRQLIEFVECLNKNDPSSSAKLKAAANCSIEGDCGNKMMQKRLSPPLKLMRTLSLAYTWSVRAFGITSAFLHAPLQEASYSWAPSVFYLEGRRLWETTQISLRAARDQAI